MSEEPTRFFALGGMLEIGKTTLVIEYKDEMVIIDAGIKFANNLETGVEGMIPNYSYLKNNQNKIKGLFITHGHEDHIGGVPFLIQQVDIKRIYAPKVAIELLKNKLKELKTKIKIEFKEIKKEKIFKFKHLEVDFWTSQHSIPDSFGIRVKTPNGTIFDTGDFRFDYSPIGNLTDFSKLEKMGREGIDILISDSTNAMISDHSPTERNILIDIENIIKNTKGKVIFTTFASNLNRIKAVIDIAAKHKRKIVAFGRSMVKGIEIGRRLKWIDVPNHFFIDKKRISSVADNELFILSTGSQGEELAALTKMSIGKHPQVKLKHNDVVIFSSSPIPGNRMKIELLINNLYKAGAVIKENKVDGILHTSGHAYQKEHEKIFKITKPRYFIPYHGAYRQSAVHTYTAIQSGIKSENTIIIDNGQVVHLFKKKVFLTNQIIDAGPIFVDGNVANLKTSEVIGKRLVLGENGFINIIALIDKKTNSIVRPCRIISRGALYVAESREFMNEIQRMAHGAILYTIKNNKNWNEQIIESEIKRRIEPFFYQKKRRNPLIVTTILYLNNRG